MAYTPKSQYKGYLFSAEDFNGAVHFDGVDRGILKLRH